MAITMRSYSAAIDRQRVIGFRRACTTLENIHDYPTVVDLYELLDTSAAREVERRFETQNMTTETRRAIMRNPAYSAELDLLLVAPDGTFAAFCYCAIPKETNELSGHKEGEIAIIGTRPSYHKRGIGRAMLLTGLQRLKDYGIETATLGTSSENTQAQSVFFSAGFHISYRSIWYSKSIR
jgi:ribosomal protein S18 acetylase RimI-like enzyme